jgi:uncharacterized protein (TIGR02646 family)
MRFVDRSSEAEPSALSDASAVKERAEAAKHYKILTKTGLPAKTVGGKPKKGFTFAVYKKDSVRAVLHKLFHGKCAYCESRYAAVHPVDIEHWRPKGAVIETDDRKSIRPYGYYWLAASWSNLLPSCIDCNRERTYPDPVTGKVEYLGKGNWFPLGGGTRALVEGEENGEEPLLLDPCSDQPRDFLQFTDTGMVIPVTDAARQDRAEASIKYYGLNRAELVLDRRERVSLIEQKIALITNLAQFLAKSSHDGDRLTENMLEDLISHELTLLQHFRNPDQPYSEMARQIIDPFMTAFRPSTAPTEDGTRS